MEITSIIMIALVVLTAVAGFFYVKGTKPYSSANDRTNKYMYVMNNKHKFKVNNKGSSLDNSGNVYLVEYEKMGL